MKRIIRFLTVIILFSVLFGVGVNGAPDLVPDIKEGIPEGIGEYLPDDVTDTEGIKNVLSFGFFFGLIVRLISEAAPGIISKMSVLFGLLIIAAVINGIKNTLNASVGNIAGYVSALCVSSAVFIFMKDIFALAESFMEQISAFMGYVIPAVVTLNVLGGRITSAGVTSVLLTGAVTVLESVCVSFIFPAIKICLCVSCAGALSEGADVSGLSNTFKQALKWVFGVIMLVLSVVLTFQSIISKNADAVTVKSIRFAVGNSIPIVGSAVSDAISTLAGGVKTMSSVLGAGCSVVLIIILAVPVVQLILTRFIIQLGAGISGMMGLSTESKILNEINSVLGFTVAVMACVSVFFILNTEILSSFMQT